MCSDLSRHTLRWPVEEECGKRQQGNSPDICFGLYVGRLADGETAPVGIEIKQLIPAGYDDCEVDRYLFGLGVVVVNQQAPRPGHYVHAGKLRIALVLALPNGVVSSMLLGMQHCLRVLSTTW